MSKVTNFTTQEVVKETYLVYISGKLLEPAETYEIEGKVKKRDPKKHKAQKENLLKFPELGRGFYYYDIYVVKLRIGNKIIETRSGRVNRSKVYEV